MNQPSCLERSVFAPAVLSIVGGGRQMVHAAARLASPLRVPNNSRTISGRSRHETNLFGSRYGIEAAGGIER